MKPIVTLLACISMITTFSQDLELDLFASGFNRPVNIKHANDDRLFVMEQDGIIKILNANGTVESTNFLDIDFLVGSSGNEQGLLGLAFHPNYNVNGYFFVYYTNNAGDTVISRFSRIGTNPEIADPNSELVILTFSQPFSNHNGGELQFGPDGYLYISSGDGGSGGDPLNNSQNLNSLLGKILRIDINNATASSPYNIPSDNPFLGSTTAREEIWAYGLRNAWKFSFDTVTDALWIADVGQNTTEEINRVSTTVSGLNYGWRCYEGNNVYNTSGCPSNNTLTFPIYSYSHTGGRCSITGGYVYRGALYPNLIGKYFFADVCTQEIGYLTQDNGNWTPTFQLFSGNFVAFGEDINGELYSASLGGDIFKITDTTLTVEEDTLASSLIYPNPAKALLHLNLTSFKGNTPVTMTIYDIKGMAVMTRPYLNHGMEKINISGLQTGFYILKLNTDKSEQITKKIIIN